jgi:hypothetical protein
MKDYALLLVEIQKSEDTKVTIYAFDDADPKGFDTPVDIRPEAMSISWGNVGLGGALDVTYVSIKSPTRPEIPIRFWQDARLFLTEDGVEHPIGYGMLQVENIGDGIHIEFQGV